MQNTFDGPDYVHERDFNRLNTQYQDLFNLMSDSKFRTLAEIERATRHPQASISSQLRNMRKQKYGSHTINKEYIGNGLYTYQLVVSSAT